MTVHPALYPGLVLAGIALGQWWHMYGLPRWREWNSRQTLLMRGLCPDCELPLSRCHCFTDDGVL